MTCLIDFLSRIFLTIGASLYVYILSKEEFSTEDFIRTNKYAPRGKSRIYIDTRVLAYVRSHLCTCGTGLLRSILACQADTLNEDK